MAYSQRVRPIPVIYAANGEPTPDRGAQLLRWLSYGSPNWCHVPLQATRPWDFAIVTSNDSRGVRTSHVHRLQQPLSEEPLFVLRDGIKICGITRAGSLCTS